MNNFFRCKVCGLVLEEDKIGEKCPACGVPRGAFESYKTTINEKRRKLLDLHIHPIVVHFPQAFTVLLPWLIIGYYLFDTALGKQMIITAQFLVMILPFAVTVAFLSGILDGMLRFKKLSTKYLITKISAAVLLLIASIGMAYINGVYGIVPSTTAPFIVLNLIAILCQIILGTVGVKLMNAVMPG